LTPPTAGSAAELRLRATKRRKAGMNCKTGFRRDKTASAACAAICAVHRNPLAPRGASAYSSLIATTQPERKDRTMKTNFATPTKARFAAFVLALVTSTTVLGATVFAMQPRYEGAGPQPIALERVVVSAPAVN
jgi:hypothetical protein